MSKADNEVLPQQQNKPKQRDYFFDNVKFLLILLVVIGHAYRPLIDESSAVKAVYLTIYTFHMPLFILISGYFAKNFRKEGQNKKVIATILVPYFIFEILYSIYDHFVYSTSDVDFSILEPYWIMWFLFSLFLWRLMLPYFVNLKYPLLTAFALAILVGYVDDADQYLSLSRTVSFFPFFLTGFYLQKHHFEKLLNWFTPAKRILSVLGIGAVLLLMYFLEYRSGVDLDLRRWLYFVYPYEDLGHSEWYAGLYRLFFIGLALIMSVMVLSLVPRKQTFFSQLGTRSIYVYLLHGFFIKLYDSLDFDDRITGSYQYVLITLAAIALTFILSSKWVQSIAHPLIQPNVQWFFQKKSHNTRLNKAIN
jgi:fucose 4-O-acetylase-like acetyltransferase